MIGSELLEQLSKLSTEDLKKEITLEGCDCWRNLSKLEVGVRLLCFHSDQETNYELHGD